ncbi:MAG: DUF4230 domain-containing protein [bacterium]
MPNEEGEFYNKKRRSGVFGRIISTVLIKVGVSAVVMAGVVYLVIYLLNMSSKAITDISENFNTGNVVNEFQSYVTKMEGSNLLQVASVKSLDKFSKTDSQSILWDLISLPDVVVELQIPVEYTYFIDLKEKWVFRWEEVDKSIIVIAPPIQCGAPAVDVSKMEITEKEGSFLRDVEEVKEKLRSELTERLKYIAVEKISLIRETAREETKHFVNNWFVKFYFKDSEFKPEKIVIYFSGETLPPESNGTIKLERKG